MSSSGRSIRCFSVPMSAAPPSLSISATVSYTTSSKSVSSWTSPRFSSMTGTCPFRGISAVAAEFVEEAGDGVQPALGGDVLVDVEGHGEVEHAQSERGEHHGPVGGRGEGAGEHVVEGAGDE